MLGDAAGNLKKRGMDWKDDQMKLISWSLDEKVGESGTTLLDCQWNEREEREGQIQRKKHRRKEGQTLIEKEKDRKKKARKWARKRRRKKGTM